MREDMCKHYEGVMQDECAKGVRYERFTDGDSFGIVKKIPCLKKNGINGCDLAEWLTAEEISEYKRKSKERMAGMMAAIALIQEKTGADPDFEPCMGNKKGAKGKIECPMCGADLYYSVAPGNNHIWAKCKAEGCLSWMM